MWHQEIFVSAGRTYSSEYGEIVVPGAMISGLYRPSKVSPTDEKYAKLSHRSVGRVKVLKVTVRLAPARRSCSKGLAVLAGMKAEGMVMATPDQLLSAVIFTKPSSALL